MPRLQETETNNQFLATFLVATGALGPRRTNFSEGFDPKKERDFIARIEDNQTKVEILNREVSTQLAEDFGLVEHVAWYEWSNGEVVIPKLGKLSEVTANGGVESEITAVARIQEMLAANPEMTVVHFSPKDENLGYKFECVDFWRIVDGKANSVRLMVKNGEEEMRKVWQILNQGVGLSEKEELRANPVVSSLKLGELFPLFILAEAKNGLTYKTIETVVAKMLLTLEERYGQKVVRDSEIIARLYSAAYILLEERTKGTERGTKQTEIRIDQGKLDYYARAQMQMATKKPSFGCSGSTMVNNFAAGEGMIVERGENGGFRVRRGKTEGLTFCAKCQCYYSGSKCPLCDKG
jgi:hypothetical protein